MLLKAPNCKHQLPCLRVVHLFTDANLTLAHHAWEPEHNIVVLLVFTK